MIKNNLHIIQRQILELELSDEGKSLEHQNRMKDNFFNNMVPVLEEVFDEYSETENYYFIDSINIDLGIVNPEDSFERVVAKFKSELNNELNTLIGKKKNQPLLPSEVENTHKASSKHTVKQLTREQAIVKAFIEYLMKGVIPVWYSVESYNEFETYLLSIKAELQKELFEFIRTGKDLNIAFYRLTIIFSERLIQHLFSIDTELHSFFHNSDVKSIYNYIETNREDIINNTSKQFWSLIKSQFILTIFKGYKNRDFNLDLFIKHLIKDNLKQQTKLFIVRFIKDLDYYLSSYNTTNISTTLQSSIKSLKNIWQNAEKNLLSLDSVQENNKDSDTAESLISDKNISKNKVQSDVLKLKNKDRSEATDKESIIKTNDSLNWEDQVKTIDTLKRLFPSNEEMEEDTEYYYIDNAGIVLLAPYLEMYFKELNLVNITGAFNDENNIERAIHNLHYLSFGGEQPIENQLILNKILCGIPVHTPIDCAYILLNDDMNEADSLLQAVIRNWKALKNTKPDGLREGFLQRSGRISKSDNCWKLIVEKKSIDILLNSIPWAYSIVKMPWMKEIIYVEWT